MPSKEKLLRDLAPALLEGEEVIDLTTGMIPVRRLGDSTERNGTIAVTDRRIILFTKKMGGYDVQDFAFGLLSSVDHKRESCSGTSTWRRPETGPTSRWFPGMMLIGSPRRFGTRWRRRTDSRKHWGK